MSWQSCEPLNPIEDMIEQALAEYSQIPLRIKADPILLGAVNIGANQTKSITLNNSILNYSYLLGQLYVGASMLSTVYIPISSLAGGSQYRTVYHDGSYPYMLIFSYVNNTKINAQSIWTPTSVSLGARILGIKEYTVAQ